ESMPAGNGAAGAQKAPQQQQARAGGNAGPPPMNAGAPRSGAAVAEPPSHGEDQRVSPAVRKLLKEHSLDVSRIRGSGMGGRVTREDVLNHIEASRVAASAPGRGPSAPAAPPAQPQPLKPVPAPAFAPAGSREEDVQQATNVRKKIAENMLRARHM